MALTPAPAELLPHAAPMVLIDSVTSWDDAVISCQASSHLAVDNPLRINGRLSVYCGIEYAAQAMAAHARLRAQGTDVPQRGLVATASKVVAHADLLDSSPTALSIDATRTVSNGDSSLYTFSITTGQQRLLEGQLMVVTLPA